MRSEFLETLLVTIFVFVAIFGSIGSIAGMLQGDQELLSAGLIILCLECLAVYALRLVSWGTRAAWEALRWVALYVVLASMTWFAEEVNGMDGQNFVTGLILTAIIVISACIVFQVGPSSPSPRCHQCGNLHLRQLLPLQSPTVIVVTGSRDWGATTVLREVAKHIADNRANVVGVYHGACRGVDTEFDQELRGRVRVYAYPANWDLGKKAGPLRNREMLDAAKWEAELTKSAIVLLAFPIIESSRGTVDCMGAARARGIAVLAFDAYGNIEDTSKAGLKARPRGTSR